jgi:hypothetical protein
VVTDKDHQARTDQFWQGATMSARGTLVVSYYDRSYGRDNTTGFSDVTLSALHGPGGFKHRRVTSSSMPPPTQFAGQFMGDYAGLDVARETAYPIWADTRAVNEFLCPGTGTPARPPRVCTASAPNAAVANDADAYIQGVRIP